MTAAIAIGLTVVIIIFFDWVPTPLNRNIAFSAWRERLIGGLIHMLTGALFVVANLEHWHWVILGAAIWYTFVLVSAIANWWVPWLSGVAAGEIRPDVYEREYARNVRILPRLSCGPIVPDVQHTLIHLAVLFTCVLNWAAFF